MRFEETTTCARLRVGIEFATRSGVSIDSKRPADPTGSVLGIALRLARYVRANPLAADTRDGIAQWWLGLNCVSVDEVERAITYLQDVGVMQRIQGADGHVRYRRTESDAHGDLRLDQLLASLESQTPRQQNPGPLNQ